MKDRWIAGDKCGGYVINKVWKRSVIEKNHIRFDTELEIFEDMKFFYQYLECCDGVSICDDNLYYYRDRDGSAVRTITADKRWQSFYALDYMRMQEKRNGNDVNAARLCKWQIKHAWLYLQRIVAEKKYSKDRTGAVVAFIKKYYSKTGMLFNTEQLARLAVCFLKNKVN